MSRLGWSCQWMKLKIAVLSWVIWDGPCNHVGHGGGRWNSLLSPDGGDSSEKSRVSGAEDGEGGLRAFSVDVSGIWKNQEHRLFLRASTKNASLPVWILTQWDLYGTPDLENHRTMNVHHFKALNVLQCVTSTMEIGNQLILGWKAILTALNPIV